MAKLVLTRDSILSGALLASAKATLPPGTRFMTDEERHRQIHDMLARSTHPERVWVFGYGSLIWNPAFHFVERRTARVHGYHRDFCLWAGAGRGSPERPGLMLSLNSGGSCNGVAYRLHPKHAAHELDVVWRREMLTMAYRPVWVKLHTPRGPEHAIAFAANPKHQRYVAHLSVEETVRLLATGAGPLGRCCDYLFDTVSHLEELGISDQRMAALARAVRAAGAC